MILNRQGIKKNIFVASLGVKKFCFKLIIVRGLILYRH